MFRFILRKDRKNKKGEYQVRLKLIKSNQRKWIALGIYGSDKYWDELNEVFIIEKGLKSPEKIKANDDRKKNNDFIAATRTTCNDIIKELDTKGSDWTLNQFEEKYLSSSKQGKVLKYFDNHIDLLKLTNKIGTANSYKDTKHILTLFDKKFKERVFSEIDYKYISNFNVYLQRRSCSGNTRKNYIKTFRALINKAIKDNEASRENYPFGIDGFNVHELEEDTKKRYLPDEYFRRIRTSCSLDKNIELVRKLYLFSYYCYGMPFVDMAKLTFEHIQNLNEGRYIVYKREKTKHNKKAPDIKIKIRPEIQTLIDELRNQYNPVDSYLLPIVMVEGLKGEQLYTHRLARRQFFNKYLKRLANDLEIEGIALTSYTSRHTMAMTLQSNEVRTETISQMMGHKDLSTTKIYLDSLDTTEIDSAANVL